jgi:hypothetical protein
MKRSLSVIVSLTLGLALAPVGATATPSSGSAVESVETSVVTPPAKSIERDSKARKCRSHCVQSTLPEAEKATFFVNDNRHLISVNTASITLRNLDTRTIVDTELAPEGFGLLNAAMSPDAEEIIIVATQATPSNNFYRLNTETLELTNVSPVSPTYPVRGAVFAVMPDHSGYLSTAENGGNKYLCHFSETGVELGCSESFSGSGQATSQIHFHYSSQFAYLVGADNTLFTFSLEDMSFTQDTLAGLDVDFAFSASYNGTSIFLAQNSTLSGDPTTTIFKISTDSESIVDTLEIPGQVEIYDLLAVPHGLYVLGQPYKSNGDPQGYSSLFYIDTYAGFDVTKTIKITNARRGAGWVTDLHSDLGTNYVLASGNGVPTSVIPVTGAAIDNTAEYHVCPTGWTVTWNYQNLQPGKPVEFYDIYLRAAEGGNWVKAASVSAGGEHTYELTSASVGQLLKVLPRKVKYTSFRPIELESGAPGIPLPGARQPRC